MALQQDRARLMAHFAGDTSKHQTKWSDLWDKGDFLPWDRGMPNPALIDILTDQRDLLGTCFVEDEFGSKRRKRALVPGCGKGYDVLLLASFGYDASGLEVSETAVKRCYEEQKANGLKYPARDESSGAGAVKFMRGDFFGTDWMINIEGDGKFDLIYDYTFLSALPPSLRPDWALRMAQLLAFKGNLICVEFPSAKDPLIGGPPFALPPQVYTEHLAHPGKELPYDEKGHVKGGVSGPRSPVALTRVAHWQPERTHEIGKGQDWVSIWRY
ncbi:MAG: hypothetical protein ASARMPRED_000506 [Alectoria sarmentosa]|nr:MAG: hypothetical protein ASARMPRED_000506 [Alectoria sarmentosa]